MEKTLQEYEKEFEEFLAREKHLALMVRSRAAKFGDSKIAVRHKPHESGLPIPGLSLGI
ncbi:MAG: hypothetical protein GXX02_10510 [Syntrophomonadaceae bacterium]|nr:hypothetical protein [Syntrophomonadaceae bacterium]